MRPDEEVAVNAMLAFHVAGDRLDRRAPPQVSFDRRRQAALLFRADHPPQGSLHSTQFAVGAFELRGEGLSLMLDERELANFRIALARVQFVHLGLFLAETGRLTSLTWKPWAPRENASLNL